MYNFNRYLTTEEVKKEVWSGGDQKMIQNLLREQTPIGQILLGFVWTILIKNLIDDKEIKIVNENSKFESQTIRITELKKKHILIKNKTHVQHLVPWKS